MTQRGPAGVATGCGPRTANGSALRAERRASICESTLACAAFVSRVAVFSVRGSGTICVSQETQLRFLILAGPSLDADARSFDSRVCGVPVNVEQVCDAKGSHVNCPACGGGVGAIECGGELVRHC